MLIRPVTASSVPNSASDVLKLLERLVLGAVSVRSPGHPCREQDRLKRSAHSLAGARARVDSRSAVVTGARGRCCSCSQPVMSAQRSSSNQSHRSRCSSRRRRSASARAAAFCFAACDERRTQQPPGMRAGALARPRARARAALHRRADRTTIGDGAAMTTGSGAALLSVCRRPGANTSSKTRRTRHDVIGGLENDADVRCAVMQTFARPLGRECELPAASSAPTTEHLSRSAWRWVDLDHETLSAPTVQQAAHRGRHGIETGTSRVARAGTNCVSCAHCASRASSIASRASQRRKNSRHQPCNARASGASNVCSASIGIR